MRHLIFISLVLLLCSCSQKPGFHGQVQYQIAMSQQEWPELLGELKQVFPSDRYEGPDGAISDSKDGPELLLELKTSIDKHYMVMVTQRSIRDDVSIILYVHKPCTGCGDWAQESNRIEAALRKHYGKRLIVNTSTIRAISLT